MQGHYNSEVDLLLENGVHWDSVHSETVVKQPIMMRSMEGDKESVKEIADNSSNGHFWSLVALFSVMALFGFIGYIIYKDDCKFS